MRGLSLKHLTALCSMVLFASLPSTFARATDLNTQVTVHIAAQRLDRALLELSNQAQFQLVLDSKNATSKTSVALSGTMSIREAIDQLLRGSDLTYRWTGQHTVTVTPGTPKSPGTSIRFDIPAEALSAALKDFTAQSAIQVAAPAELITGKTSKAAHGTMAATDALRRVLKGTDLTFVLSADGGFAVQANAGEGPSQEKADVVDVLVESQQQKEKLFSGMNVDIPRTINDVQPYYIFDSKTIDQSGSLSVEDFLKQRLTMNTVAQTNGQISGLNALGNSSTINLRGVGTDKTLILINGRRMPGINVGGPTGNLQPDINGIPLSAIDRIEVLPSSASGIYGGSAIGGVVNIILKSGYTGGEIQATYDSPWDTTDGSQRTVSASYGLALGGKTHLTANASWSDGSSLLLQDRRSIFEENLASIQSRLPTFIYSRTNPWLGALPNILPTSSALTTLTLNNNGVPVSLNSRNTYVPAGTSTATAATDLTAGLLANAGKWDLDFPQSTQSPTGLLRPFGVAPKTKSFMASISSEMLPRLQLFADYSYTDNQSESISNQIFSTLTVPANAPTNPFTTAVRVRVPDASQLPITVRSQNLSATLGALAQLPWGWTGDVDYTWSENRFNELDYEKDFSAQTADLLSGVLNPFVDTLHYPLNIKKYLFPSFYQGSNRLSDLAARGSGPLPALPWGTPSIIVGLEHRIARTPENTYRNDYPITVANSFIETFYEQVSTTDSGYLEATVPLVKTAWLPGLHSLDLQLSGRSERYKVSSGTPSKTNYYAQTPPTITYGDPTLNGQPYFSEASYTSRNYTVGLKYQPVPELTLRVSRATAFLPPTPNQLIKNPQTDNQQGRGLTTIIDPMTGAPVDVDTLSGGNPKLKPQNSKSTNLGLIWEPRWQSLQGLRLDAEYYKIEQFNAIGGLDAQTIVNHESVYPGRVVRDSSGIITLVDTSSVNLYHLDTEGWDLSADYSVKTGVGRFSLRAVETVIQHLRTQYDQTVPEYDAVNFPSEGGAAKYKSNATLNWDWRQWTAGWTVRYFSSYKQNGAAGGPSSVQGTATTYWITGQGSDTIPSQTYHDLFLSYAFGPRITSSPLTVQLGVRNVFDKVPPLDVYYSNNYYLSPYGDVRLRSFWLNARKSF